MSSTALTKVPGRDSGVASASVNTTSQVGASLGAALLNTVAATATATYVASLLRRPHLARRRRRSPPSVAALLAWGPGRGPSSGLAGRNCGLDERDARERGQPVH